MKEKTKQALRQVRMRATALALIFAMALVSAASLPTEVFAAGETASKPSSADITNDMEISGSGSFGTLLVATIENYDTGNASSEYSVTDLKIHNQTATVQYNAVKSSSLIVAVYSEDGTELLGTGSVTVDPNENSADVNISIAAMPKYYLAKAFLLDQDSHTPLCKAYTCELYTKAIQDIQAMSVNDFSDSQVLNLDQDPDTNFAVYSDDVEIIESDNNTNVYNKTLSNENSGIYVFNHADSQLTSLGAGDIFSQQSGSDVLIVKVASIKSEKQSDGSYQVTITEDQHLDLQDVFDYVKIENDGQIDSYVVDNSTADEGVTDISPSSGAGAANAPVSGGWFDWLQWSKSDTKDLVSINKNISHTTSHTTLNVDLHLNIALTITAYVSGSNCYVDLSLDTDANLHGTVTGSLSKDFKLGSISMTMAYGAITVSMTPTFQFSASAKLDIEAGFQYKMGFNCSTKNGLVNTSNAKPTLTFNVQVEGEMYLGMEFAPSIRVLQITKNTYLAEISAPAEVGLKITGAYSNQTQHACTVCIDGDFYLLTKLEPKVSFLGDDNDYNYSKTLVDRTKKVGDWYYSLDHNELGMGECPYGDMGGKCGDDLIWNLDLDTGIFTVTGSGDMWDYDSSTDAPWWTSAYSIVEIQFKGKITSIGNYAFANCTTITSVEIPESVMRIGDNAFGGCTKLRNITIPDAVTSIGAYAFSGCTKLKSVTMTDSVTSIGDYAFHSCTSLTSINLPDSITAIPEGAFCGDSALPSITIPNSVRSIGYAAFQDCSKLQSITIPNSVRSIGYAAFQDCSKLQSITIPNSVLRVDNYAFWGSGLTSVTLSNSVKYMGQWVFYYCEHLTDVYYYGDEEDWEDFIVPTANNNPLINATIHFMSGSGVKEQTVSNSDQPLAAVSGGSSVFTESPLTYAVSGAAASANHTATFQKLTSGSEYLFVVLKSDTAENLFGSGNILYIDQAAADSDGKLNFEYKLNTADYQMKLYGTKELAVSDYLVTAKPGDLDGDGKINGKDSTRLMQYLAGWDVEIDTTAADLNGDGKVNGKDSTLLMQYLAGWDVKIG